jgi:hypothetical protein
MSRLVHALESKSRGYRTVADHGNHLEILSLDVPCGDHAERRGDRRTGMAHIKTVEGAFFPLRKTADPAVLAYRGKLRAPARKNFMSIGLMPHIPHDAVLRSVEGAVQRNGQIDNAETRREVSAGFGHHLDDLLPELLGELRQLRMG